MSELSNDKVRDIMEEEIKKTIDEIVKYLMEERNITYGEAYYIVLNTLGGMNHGR